MNQSPTPSTPSPLRRHRWRPWLILLLALGASLAQAVDLPNLRVRQAGVNANRIIEDTTGKPFFVAGWNPQNIVQTLPASAFDAYFKARRAQGFTIAWVCAAPFDWRQPFTDLHWNARDYAGNRLMLNPALATYGSLAAANLNPAYVASVDAMVDAAANNGIYLFLDLINQMGNGYNLSGQCFQYRSQQECYEWGRFWGDRYARMHNVHWSFGNDAVPMPQANWVVQGINVSSPDRLYIWDVGSLKAGGMIPDPTKAVQDPMASYLNKGASWMNLWAWYDYEYPSTVEPHASSQYMTWLMYTQTWAKTAPTFIAESEYASWSPSQAYYLGEGDGGIAKQVGVQGDWALRRSIWATPLGGGTGWGILGDNEIVDTNSLYLNDPVFAKYANHCQALLTARHWEQLVPDYAHTFLTSQATNPGKDVATYVSAAIALDRSFAVVYHPGLAGMDRSLTVDLTKIAGGSAKLSWFDPTSNQTLAGTAYPTTGTATLAMPGNNSRGSGDWVLLVESVPGVPALPVITTQPLSLSVTAGQTATFTVAATGSAPIYYGWQKNGVWISGAYASSYTTPATTIADSGTTYRCCVYYDATRQVFTTSAALTVQAASSLPVITGQPASRTVITGQTATFTVAATGSAPIYYGWQRNGVWISGAYAPSYTTPATTIADSGTTYRCCVYYDATRQVFTTAATLNVVGGQVFADDDSAVSGGSRILGAVASSQSASPLAGGGGSYLHWSVPAGTPGAPLLATYTPASPANSWAAWAGTTTVGGVSYLTLNGGFDLFVRPGGTTSLSGNAWFRPVDIGYGGPVQLYFCGTNEGRLWLQLRTSAAAALGSAPGSFTTNDINNLPGSLRFISSPIFALGAVSHVGFTCSTDPATGRITVKVFGTAGSGTLDTGSSVVGQGGLLGMQGFYASAAAIGANPLPGGAWNLVTVPYGATAPITVDYDSIRLFSPAPLQFPGLPAVPLAPGAAG